MENPSREVKKRILFVSRDSLAVYEIVEKVFELVSKIHKEKADEVKKKYIFSYASKPEAAFDMMHKQGSVELIVTDALVHVDGYDNTHFAGGLPDFYGMINILPSLNLGTPPVIIYAEGHLPERVQYPGDVRFIRRDFGSEWEIAEEILKSFGDFRK